VKLRGTVARALDATAAAGERGYRDEAPTVLELVDVELVDRW
jgi:hypothetical protein